MLVLLCGPAVGFLAVFFVTPLALMLWTSVTEPRIGLGNYVSFFTSATKLKVLFSTLQMAAIVTLCCILIGYPIAYVAAQDRSGLAAILLIVVALSFWTNFLVRVYAWMVILSNNGPAAMFLSAVGWRPPPKMLFTTFAATVAMTQMLVPFMILALYSVMRRIDPAYMRAAASLGAKPFRAFLTVYLPLSAPGIVNGATLVFITCLGFYVTPVLIGSPSEKMFAGLIGEQIEQFIDFGGGSAMAVILLLLTLTLYAIYNRFVGIDKLWK